MHRSLFFSLGLIEVAAAVALLVLGLGLPSPHDVRLRFDRARRVTVASRDPVRLIRGPAAWPRSTPRSIPGAWPRYARPPRGPGGWSPRPPGWPSGRPATPTRSSRSTG